MLSPRFLPILGLLGVVPAQDWPVYQHDAQRTGATPTRLSSTIKSKWSVQVHNNVGLHPPVAASGMVFVSSRSTETLYAYRASDGALLWKKDFSAKQGVQAPGYADGRVYIQVAFGSDSRLHCFDAKTGKELFSAKHTMDHAALGAPAISDGVVYTNGAPFGGVIAFDAKNGAVLFSNRSSSRASSPAVDTQHAYVFGRGLLLATQRKKGTPSWFIRDPLQFSNAAPVAPMLGDEREAYVAGSLRLVRFDLASRRLKWGWTSDFYGQPALGPQAIYVLNGRISTPRLEARSRHDGKLLWSWTAPTGQRPEFNVILTGTHVITASSQKTFVLDRATRKVVFEAGVGGWLAVGNDSIYVAGYRGKLAAFRIERRPAVVVAEPARMHFAHLPPTLTVRGDAFRSGFGLKVQIGGVDATNVKIVADGTLTCTPPHLGPGSYAVRVVDRTGAHEVKNAISYYPALRTSGDQKIGEDLGFSLVCGKRDHLFLVLGPALSSPIRVPGMDGLLGITPQVPFASAAYWYTTVFQTSVRVPNDPRLIGLRTSVQALATPSNRPHPSAFSNRVDIRLR